jgi:pimeloyl-ACP methyl ester carboxylesterase
MAAGGWIPRMGAAKGLPSWLTQADLDYYVREFTEAGFRGGINYYRNFHRNWETTPQLAGVKITKPALFIAGSRDTVIGGRTAEQLTASMSNVMTDFRGTKLIPGIGHWVQQESPAETNTFLIEFLKGLK